MQKYFYPFVRTRLHVGVIFFFLQYFILAYYAKADLFYPVIFAFTIWHYALYIFDRSYDADRDFLSNQREAIPRAQKYFWLTLSLVLAVLPFIILYLYHFKVLPYLILFPFTFLYTLEIFPGKKRVRNFTGIKNLYSAIFIWTLPLYVLLHFYTASSIDILSFLKAFWPLLLFVFMGEIIWDVRDIEADEQNRVNTIPVRIGITKTKLLLFFLLGVYLLFAALFQQVDWNTVIGVAVFTAILSKRLPQWAYHVPLFASIAWYLWRFMHV